MAVCLKGFEILWKKISFVFIIDEEGRKESGTAALSLSGPQSCGMFVHGFSSVYSQTEPLMVLVKQLMKKCK